MHWRPSEADEAEEVAFRRLYGDWDALDPAGLTRFMAAYDREWWVVGGWAIDAFTGLTRPHEDIDAVIWLRDLPRFREMVGDRHHIWSAGAGAIRPVDDDWPEPHEGAGQVWLRDHARAPWFLDCLLAEDRDGQWVSRRDPEYVAPLEDVTWVADDGIRYLNPEIGLLFKAGNGRRKDDRDFDRCLPLLTDDARTWLAESIAGLYPDHAWLARLS